MTHEHEYRVPASAAECKVYHAIDAHVPAVGCYNVVKIRIGPAKESARPPAGFKVPTRPDAGYPWVNQTNTISVCSAVSCRVWHSNVSTEYVYNGINVWQWWVDCSDYGGIGFSVSISWCGYWNNGGYHAGYMNMGDNFTVSAFFKGFPISTGYWDRYNVGVGGNWWQTWG